MTKTHCKLCDKEIKEFLTHLILDHNVKSVEEYNDRLRLEEEKARKEAEYQ